MNKSGHVVEEAINAGANGFVIKDSGHQVLTRAIKELLIGNEYWDPRVLQLLIDAKRSEFSKGASHNNKKRDIRLTKREMDVLQLLAEGLSSKQIGEELFIGTSTVDMHRKNLIAKFEAKNSTEVVMRAKEFDLI